ncbi:hypothetical protein CAPTEDRAFT_169085 [Capitella teleta]|uniref:Lipoxygenase domain-containing protein n=1 Tax=Capitella teleta TaxID=283909 RepID=R7UV30_CAPTE|nr:hypothetical protein CAPTEDRAFT_169085 [Capitella teleta]|eukprot:ELU07246.1 hypothetical protein CAPTEDRAFT_169085 [Capitella teleta]
MDKCAIPPAGLGSKTRLSYQSNKAKKSVAHTNSAIRRCNAVGAVGYAVVLKETRLPDNEFFTPGRRFRIRLRHSNLRCDDDAAACIREAAVKFADQNEDGPLDLIFFTGRTAVARNCKTFSDIIKLKKEEDMKDMCMKDPHYWFALADGLRKSPGSFADLIYYSQIPYKFIPFDEKPRLMKFRLIPAEPCRESGRLDENEQAEVWNHGRRACDNNTKFYLRNEYMRRLERDDPIKYVIQAQMIYSEDVCDWNPQKIWDEVENPWFDLIKIKLTTALTCTALHRTYFNIVDKPTCLKFPSPTSIHDYKSYPYVCSAMYTKFEIKHLGLSVWREERQRIDFKEVEKIKHHITLCTGTVKEGRPRVDVFITLTGSQGRTTPKRLDHYVEDETSKGVDEFYIHTEPIGDLVSVIIAVRHRHLTDDWYLRYVTVTDPDRGTSRHFPCHSVVLSKVALRPGEVSLPQYDCHEVLRQERLLELRDRHLDYLWQRMDALPGQVRLKSQDIKLLPVNEQLTAEKYVGVQWDIDPAMADVIIPKFVKSCTNATQYYDATTLQPGLPDGPKGDMCKSVQDDVDFGRIYLMGTNPAFFKRIESIPENFHISHGDVEGYLDRELTLEEEMQAGRVFLADYKILEDIYTFHQDADNRYMVAPLCLLYVRGSGDLIPLGIQLKQEPGPDNPLFTARDKPEDWVMAKLWVRCADFQYQFPISHFFMCHLVIEPFCVATQRQLSVSHPVYKLLKPHFRYTLPTNTILRRNILKKGGSAETYMSIGSEGFKSLVKKFYTTEFSFESMDLPLLLNQRGVDDAEKLPNYFYRDDSLKLWQAISEYCLNILKIFYKSDEDVQMDSEIQAWIEDIQERGFPGLKPHQREGLPMHFDNVEELARTMTKILFTSTCQHSATHSEALDMYGFLPLTPAMMRMPPPSKKRMVGRDVIVKSLPDQSPLAYYGSLANVMQFHKPDENPLGNNDETYFVEQEAIDVKDQFSSALGKIAIRIKARNAATSIQYENLIPNWIPNSTEVLPFYPSEFVKDTGGIPVFEPGVKTHVFSMSPSAPLMTLPLSMYMARNFRQDVHDKHWQNQSDTMEQDIVKGE